MGNGKGFSRRSLIGGSLGAIAFAAATPVGAAVTPAQIEGPFFPTRDQADKDLDMTRIAGRSERALGTVIAISGVVVDDSGVPVKGALIDIWQANSSGRYDHEAETNPAPLDPNFQGWARLTTDADGRYRVTTIRPGHYPVREGWSRPAHIHFKVARRGYRELITQMYFADDPLNDADLLLNALDADDRARVTVAFAGADADGVQSGRFDIVLKRV